LWEERRPGLIPEWSSGIMAEAMMPILLQLLLASYCCKCPCSKHTEDVLNKSVGRALSNPVT